MGRKKIVAGNWKMNLLHSEAIELAKNVSEINTDNVEVIVSPSQLYLSEIANLSSTLNVAAQNINPNPNGAYTGEVSVSQLKSVGAEYSLVGHSERREYFKEDYSFLKNKVDALLAEKFTPIFCFGEVLSERETGNHFSVVKEQLEYSLFHLTENEFSNLILAYEPVWAIGTGVTASPDQAQEMHAFIRKTISEKYSTALAENIRILYGGSCKPSNAEELFSQPDIDGGLIGGASLKIEDFSSLIDIASKL